MSDISDNLVLEALQFLTRKELSLCMELVSHRWHRLASTSPHLRPRHIVYRFSLENNVPLCRTVIVIKDGNETGLFPIHSLVGVPVTTIPHYLRFENVTIDNMPVSEENLQWLRALRHTFDGSTITLLMGSSMGVESEETLKKVAISAVACSFYVCSPNYEEDTPLNAHGLSVKTIADWLHHPDAEGGDSVMWRRLPRAAGSEPKFGPIKYRSVYLDYCVNSLLYSELRGEVTRVRPIDNSLSPPGCF